MGRPAKRRNGLKLTPDGPCTVREEAFCREYQVDGIGAQAAERAGVKASAARYWARNALKRPRVQALLGQIMAERAAKSEVKADDVCTALLRIAKAAEEEGKYDSARACLVDYGRHIGMWPRGIQWAGSLPPFEQMTDAQIEHLAKGGDPAQLPRT